jgi:hypothetical protein
VFKETFLEEVMPSCAIGNRKWLTRQFRGWSREKDFYNREHTMDVHLG